MSNHSTLAPHVAKKSRPVPDQDEAGEDHRHDEWELSGEAVGDRAHLSRSPAAGGPR